MKVSRDAVTYTSEGEADFRVCPPPLPPPDRAAVLASWFLLRGSAKGLISFRPFSFKFRCHCTNEARNQVRNMHLTRLWVTPITNRDPCKTVSTRFLEVCSRFSTFP
ncbi:unnamed protein product [Rangifer tarandus platyrhynchus]|uniref:Uncharacterized protein n=2 Tax=Rangifer tarandus platyrhynchus TaxID=3082113 RepID=A0ABN8Y510_RANTA|nr:unnamed protein product [Rangifer tarandus platyrhynchus]